MRYFNPVGCGYGIGRDYKPVTALVPIILQVAQGKRDNIEIFGIDYKTKDGTPVRDFVHVLDLAKAHILALQYQKEKQTNIILNVATGKGQSVKEVIKIVEEVTGKDIPTIESPRREGDIGISMASAERLEKEFGWKPTKSIREMIVSDWEWLNKK